MNLFNSGQAWQAGRADRGETGRQSLQLELESCQLKSRQKQQQVPHTRALWLGRVCAVVTGRDDDGAAAQGVSSCLSSSSKSSSSATPASSMSGLESSNANNSSFT